MTEKTENLKMGRAIGIDLGTTNSCVAYINESGKAEVIVSREGGRTIPSIVAFTENDILVGQSALSQEGDNAENTIRSVKRHMGTNWRDTHFDKQYSPEQISSYILRKIKEDAETHLGAPVTRAVITVPAYFDHNQRQATVAAGELAGLEVLRIINEPTAAALAYGLGSKENQTVLVYDLGGGTFDVTVLKISGNGLFQVLSTAGDTTLGGDDFDSEIEKLIIENAGVSIDINSLDKTQISRLRDAAEKAKKELSNGSLANISIPYFSFVNEKMISLKSSVTRSQFENAIKPLVERTRKCVIQCMNDAKVAVGDIDEVVFVGGSTRVPLIIKSVESWLGKIPNRSVNPDEAVGLGAAIQAGIITRESGHKAILIDVTPLTLGVETLNDAFVKMIKRNTSIPCEHKEIFSTAEDDQEKVDIRVYQGERARASLNRSLGEFHLLGLPPAPRGVPQVEVTFTIDRNGILSVTAKENISGAEQTVTMTGSSSLTSEEIAKMVAESEAHALEDAQFQETVDAQDNLRSKLFQIDALLTEHRDVFSEEGIAELEDAKVSLEDIIRSPASLEAMTALSVDVTDLIKQADKKASDKTAEEVAKIQE